MRAANAVADGVEFDVRETRDGVLVLNHDPDAFGFPVSRTDFQTLRTVSERLGAPIATLEEAVVAIEPGKFVKAEVKVGGIASRVGDALGSKFGNRFRIGGFRFSFIADAPLATRWLITIHALQALPYRRRLRGIDYHHGSGWVRRWGLESSAWAVVDARQVHRLIRSGTQFLTTDDPVGIRKALP